MQHKPGIYFNLPFDQYLAIPALSNSGIKNLVISRMDFWANSWMNPNPPQEKEARHFLDGRAYHARILEGAEVFEQRYAPAFDDSKYPDALDKNDDMKEFLRQAKAAGHDVKLTGNKADFVAQIQAINPEVQIMDVLKAEYARENAGREFIDRDTMQQIELASAMIEKHPQLSKCFQGGYAEVTVLWIDEAYDIPMKARFDFLKTEAIVDLKTFANSLGKPIDRAIYGDIAANKYHIQAAVYHEAAAMAKRFVEQGNAFDCVHTPEGLSFNQPTEHVMQWLHNFAKANEPQFVFVFQQKGHAPLARGKIFPKGLVYQCGVTAVRDAMEEYVRCVEAFGATGTPWVDTSPIEGLDDEGFPAWIAEA